MEQDILDEVTDWTSEPVGSGYEGLRDLTAGDFSGAVTTGSVWIFVLNGRLLGPVGGDLTAFEDADLTAYAAPDPAVTLLFAMRATGGETRARYYTNDTPLSEANDTLAGGNFTGYVELSENVLSGDYYVSYYGGKSMSVAWVGTSRRLLTGEDAFEQANDEVGIYEVTEVDLDLVDVPDPASDDTTDDESGEADDDAGQTAVGFEAADDDAPDAAAPDDGTSSGEPPSDADPAVGDDPADTPEADPLRDPEASGATPSEAARTAADAGGPADSPGETGRHTDANESRDPSEPAVDEGGRIEREASAPGVEADDPDVGDQHGDTGGGRPVTFGDRDPETGRSEAESDPGRQRSAGEDEATDAAGAGADGSDVFSEEARWREARAIPALDPSETASEAESPQNGPARGPKQGTAARTRRRAGRTARGTPRAEPDTTEGTASTDRDADRTSADQQSTPTRGERATATGDGDVSDRLRTLRAERDELASRVETLESERDELETEHAELRAERDRLRSRVDELEAEVESLQSDLDTASLGLDADDGLSPERSMTPAEALRGTNLFVRYDNKGKPTLRSAHDENADPAEVNANLRLEYHTTFDADAVGVDGEPFEDFLEETIEYNFVDWVVRKLIYEIRDTGNETDLDGLYDAIPEIDRIELRGTVDVDGADGEEPGTHEFDVVLWDGMGNPLFVANLNDSREAASGNMVQTLAAGGRAIAAVDETFGGAFLVTSSFFDPAALEVANDETGAGLLSRSRRKSFVKLSRKSGFHLCLVEARSDEFYVNFPDL